MTVNGSVGCLKTHVTRDVFNKHTTIRRVNQRLRVVGTNKFNKTLTVVAYRPVFQLVESGDVVAFVFTFTTIRKETQPRPIVPRACSLRGLFLTGIVITQEAHASRP